jgi:hypothetical protein
LKYNTEQYAIWEKTMTTPRDLLPKTSPLVQKRKLPTRKGVDTRGLLSIVTMLVSLAAISIAMVGGAKLIYDILEGGIDKVNNMPAKIIVLAFPFLFGWAAGLVSIRAFGNLIYPIIIKIYSWGCLLATCYLYFEVILKMFDHDYTGQKFGIYLIILLGILLVLFFLHLLVEGHDLRPFAIPLLIISVVHLFVIVYHFIFAENAGGLSYAVGDFIVFILMITISGLMLMHVGIFSRLREMLGDLFSGKAEEDNENGNGVK